MSDYEGELSEELRESIGRMDRWLKEVEASYLASPELAGFEEKRCRAVTTFERLRVDIDVTVPPRAELIEFHLEAVPLQEVEGDVN